MSKFGTFRDSIRVPARLRAPVVDPEEADETVA